MNRGIQYVLLSFGLWLIVEYLTVWHSRVAEWLSLFPYVLLQYLLIVLVFWYFIFRRQWPERRLFLLMLGVMYLFEFLWRNPLLLNPLAFAPASLLLASIWGFLTFIPLWLVQGSLRSRKLPAIACLVWLPLGFVFAVVFG
jgi:hypothetical protein